MTSVPTTVWRWYVICVLACQISPPVALRLWSWKNIGNPRCNWYWPSGIGTGRGLSGFHNWHQIPFLNGLPDPGGISEKQNMFADGYYVGLTGWPGMRMTVSGDGWLGIPPAEQQITMRNLDFWRCEKGLIHEN